MFKKAMMWMALFLLVLTSSGLYETANAAVPLKVAFIGDSITYGIGTSNAATMSYPVKTGQLLGSGYEIRNYGVSSSTMLKQGNKPYWNQQQYTDSKNWNPDIVVIMLGTNDSKPLNWVYKDEFVSNMKEMINSYKSLPSQPKVYINTSPKVYNDGLSGITDVVVSGEVVPKQWQAARETGTPVTDINTVTSGMASNFPDDVHPNDAGAQVIANAVALSLKSVMHNDTDASAVYTGSGWKLSSSRGFGDYMDNVHATRTNGDYVEYTFTGSRIDYITETNADEGNVDVYIDGVFQATVNCYSATRYAQATVFSKSGLSSGTHTIKLVKTSGTWMLVDAFRTES
ncbi:GDSL-type esterase/lipase family protein [Paenibacillus sp. H1-7]|uniref:GDSL-type esterase/lipase family protein n=1 Tax=Paenibacillus sp. H1-7 TaxID=2282849 RepID=UPI001EF7CE77|nr:GDSL-type esterase/lipase family protein [Paenibacillus sp. H1-7]